VLEKIISLIESEAGMAFLDFYALWKQFPDVPMDFVENVLSKRDDLDKAQVKEIMETCRTKAKEEIARVEGVGPTVFSKMGAK
ncbi:hypothetical protein HDV00_004942, partial [Rhizophlyctis rosea]